MPTWDRITALPTALQGQNYPMVLCRDGATLYLLGENAHTPATASEYYPFYSYSGGVWTELTGPAHLVAEDIDGNGEYTSEWWRRAQAYNLGDGRLAFAGWAFRAVTTVFGSEVTTNHYVRRLVRVYDIGTDTWLDYDDTGFNLALQANNELMFAGWTQVGRAPDGKLWMIPYLAGYGDIAVTGAIRTWNPATTAYAAVSSVGRNYGWYYDESGTMVYGDFGFLGYIGSTLYCSTPLSGSGMDGYLRYWSGSAWVTTAYTGNRLGPTWGTYPSVVDLTPEDVRMAWTFAHNGDQGTAVVYAAFAKAGTAPADPAGYTVYRFSGTTQETLEDFPDVTPDAGAINLYVGTRVYITCKNGVYWYNDGTSETAVVSITTPAEGATIGRTVTVTGTYSGFTPGAGAEAAVSIGAETSPLPITIPESGAGTLELTWTIPETIADGEVDLVLSLVESTGGSASASHTHTVTLSTGAGSGPVVTFVTPEDGDDISGTVVVIVSATDDGTVASVSLSVDGSTYGTLTAANDGTGRYRWSISTRDWLNGAHTFTATAVDDGGLTGSATIDVNLVNESVDAEAMFYTVRLGTDGSGNLITAGVSTVREGPWRRGIASMLLQPSADLPTNPALRRNVWIGIHVPGTSLSWPDYTLVELDREFAFPDGALVFRGAVKALRQQTTANWDLGANAGLAFATASNGDPLILAGTPYRVLRYSLQSGSLSLLQDLSTLETAPTHIAAAGGKVYLNSGARLVILDEDTGDLTFRGTLGFPDEFADLSAVATDGTTVYLAGELGDGTYRLIEFSFGAPRVIATPTERVTLLRWAAGKLYGGTASGKVMRLDGTTWTQAAATGAASVEEVAALADVVLAGTGSDGHLWSTTSGSWALEQDFGFTSVRGLAAFRGFAYAGGTGSGGNMIWYRNDDLVWVQTVELEAAAVAGVNALMAVTPSAGVEYLFALTAGTGGELGYNGRLYRIEVAPDAEIVCGPNIPDLVFAVTGD